MRALLVLAVLLATVAVPSTAAQTGSESGTPAASFIRPDGTLDLSDAPPGALDLTGLDVAVEADGSLHASVEGEYVDMSNGPNGVPFDNIVQALVLAPDGTIYAGGDFTVAGGVPASRVAQRIGTEWVALGEGMNESVRALALAPDGTLYAGGLFTTAGGVEAARVARWDGTAWHALGSGITTTSTTAPVVHALAVTSNDHVYAGGVFTTAGGVAASHIARWDGTAWHALGSGLTANSVNALLASPGGSLYVGGAITGAGGLPARGVVRWSGTAWSPLGNDVIGRVLALALSGDGRLYAAGPTAYVGSTSNSTRVFVWNGTAWSPVGSGFSQTSSLTYGRTSLAVTPDGSVYVGGAFYSIGGVQASQIARWDGMAWSPVGGGFEVLSTGGGPRALVVDAQGDLVIGGYFRTASGVTSPYLVRYDAPAIPPTTGAFAFLQPTLGDTYRVGSVLKAIWTSPAPAPAQVVLTLRKSGAFVAEIYRGPNLTQPDFGAARYVLPVGTPAGDDYTLRIEDATDASRATESEAFTVTDPGAAFTVTAPTTGQALALGATTAVAWTAPAGAPGGTVEIAVVDKQTGTVAATTATANDGEGELTLPSGPAGSYYVTVTSVENPVYTGRSGNLKLSVVGVTSPAAGASFDESDALSVAWEAPTLADPSAMVTVVLKRRSGGGGVRLARDTANDGLFETTVPTGLAPGDDYFVVVRVTGGGTTYSGKSGLLAIQGTGVPPAPRAAGTFALSPMAFGTREATVTVSGLADGTEVGVYAGRSLVGAGVAQGGVATFDVRGSIVLEGLVVGAVAADDVVEVADGTALALVTMQGGVERVLETAAPVVFADGAELAVVATGGASGEASASASVLSVSAWPNPTAGAATVRLSMASAGAATVGVYDVLGRRVAVLFDGAALAGTTEVTWDARSASPGVYVVRATSGAARASQRVTVVR